MNSQNLAFVSMTLENKLAQQDKFLVVQQCENLDDDSISLFSTLNLKSPLTGLLIHWLAGIFGGGRFYKGDIMQGILYIVASVVLFILFVSGAVIEEESGDETLLGVSALFFCVYIIVFIADYYFIYKGIQKDNLDKIQKFLFFHQRTKQ